MSGRIFILSTNLLVGARHMVGHKIWRENMFTWCCPLMLKFHARIYDICAHHLVEGLFSTWLPVVVESSDRNLTIQCRLFAVMGPQCTQVSKMEWLFDQTCVSSVLMFCIHISTAVSRPKHPSSPTNLCK